MHRIMHHTFKLKNDLVSLNADPYLFRCNNNALIQATAAEMATESAAVARHGLFCEHLVSRSRRSQRVIQA